MQPISFSFTGSPVGTSLAVIGRPIILGARQRDLGLSITNTGAASLTHFAIQVSFDEAGPWITLLADADFDAPDQTLLAVSGGADGAAPQTLPASQTAWMRLDPGAVCAIQFLAAASSPTTLNLFGAARLQSR